MENKQTNTITYPLIINEGLWELFKGKVTRNITLNDALIKLIQKEVGSSGVKNNERRNNPSI